MSKLEQNPNANPTDIVGSLETRGHGTRYDSLTGIAPNLDFYAEGDGRDVGVTEDGDFEVLADTEPGDVEARESEAYRRSLLSETVASVLPGASSHPFSQGQEAAKAPEVHDLLNPTEGGEVLGEGADPDAEVASIEGEEEDRATREREAAEAGRAVLEGNPQEVLNAEGAEGHTVSTGLDNPQETLEPQEPGEPDGVVIDVNSEAAGPDGVVTGEDAEESIQAAQERREGDEGTDGSPEPEANYEIALDEGWESDLTNDAMLDAARERDIEGVNSGSKKAELIAALKEWQNR